MDIIDIPIFMRMAMPYCVKISNGRLEILGREYGELIKVLGCTPSGYTIPKRMPTRKMLERWADGPVELDKENRTYRFWFYGDGGRSLVEYARAIKSFGEWVENSCVPRTATIHQHHEDQHE